MQRWFSVNILPLVSLSAWKPPGDSFKNDFGEVELGLGVIKIFRVGWTALDCQILPSEWGIDDYHSCSISFLVFINSIPNFPVTRRWGKLRTIQLSPLHPSSLPNLYVHFPFVLAPALFQSQGLTVACPHDGLWFLLQFMLIPVYIILPKVQLWATFCWSTVSSEEDTLLVPAFCMPAMRIAED